MSRSELVGNVFGRWYSNERDDQDAVFVAIAAGLAGTAFLTRPQVNRATSEFVEDRAPFYPDVNPDGVKGLEVTAYDKEKGELDSFSVKLQNGVWIIPSHNNYPADAAERLKKTAGAVLGLQKDTVVSGGKELHKECGLLDPADTSGDADSWERASSCWMSMETSSAISSSARMFPIRPTSSSFACRTKTGFIR